MIELRTGAMSLIGATVLAVVLVRPRVALGEERNRCGCYRDTAGACFCERKATCGCSGECEPRGCEEKRERELQKEIQAETKKAQKSGRQQLGLKEQESESTERHAKETRPAPAGRRLTAAQTKQFGKLLGLYLSGHPGAGGRSLQDLRTDLTSAR